MKAKLAEEFYSMVEYLKTKDIGDFTTDILDGGLGCLYDYTENCLYHDDPEETSGRYMLLCDLKR